MRARVQDFTSYKVVTSYAVQDILLLTNCSAMCITN